MTAGPAGRRSAGVVVVRRFGGEWRCLVLRAYRNWDFPKGEIERGEQPLAAALRETLEETGLGSVELRWGDDYIETAPYGRGKVARYYLAEAGEGDVYLPVNALLGRPEHHEFRWVGFDEAARISPARLQDVVAWAAAKVSRG